MDYLVTAGAIVGIIVLVYLIAYLNYRRDEKQFREKLKTTFGTTSKRAFNVEEYLYIDRYLKKHEVFGQVNDQTWQDLGLELVYHEMNTSLSSCGAEYLYYLLHTPLFKEEERDVRAKKIDIWKVENEKRLDIQMLYHRLGKLTKYSIYDYLDALEDMSKVQPAKLLLWDFILLFSMPIMFISMPLGLFMFFVALIHNVVTYYQNKSKINPYLTSFRYIFRMLQTAYELEGLLSDPIFQEEKDKITEIKKCFHAIRNGNGLLINSSANSNPMGMVFDYINMIFSFDLMQFTKMQKVIERNLDSIDAVVGILGSVESYIMIASYQLSKSEVGCVPRLSPDCRKITAKCMIHPLLEEPIANDITIHQNLLLTGSNASGKSTFLKTVILNQLFAQTICFTLASFYEAPYFAMQTSMSLKDNVISGDSYYMMEIKAIKNLFDLASASQNNGVPFLCCIDEVLRGTNTIERIAASTEILRQLAIKGVYCLAATHDIELTDLLKDYFENYHFEESLDGQDVIFSYQIKDGKATTRNAIQLLESLGFDEEVVKESNKRAIRFEKEGVWS